MNAFVVNTEISNCLAVQVRRIVTNQQVSTCTCFFRSVRTRFAGTIRRVGLDTGSTGLVFQPSFLPGGMVILANLRSSLERYCTAIAIVDEPIQAHAVVTDPENTMLPNPPLCGYCHVATSEDRVSVSITLSYNFKTIRC